MNIFFRAQARRLTLLLAASASIWLGPIQARAATSTLGEYRVEADLLSATSKSGKLSGHVRVFSPRAESEPFLDLRAGLVTADSIRPFKARAQNGVSLVYRTTQARPDKTSSKISVEAKAQNITLDLPSRNSKGRRVLRLSGDVDGFYEINGARSSLRGSSATISLGDAPGDVEVSVEGGTGDIELKLPAQNFGNVSLGILTLKAGRVQQKGDAVSLEGGADGARLQSEGPAKLQVSAPSFDAAFAISDGARQLSRLSSRGRTSISFELPPDEARQLFSKPDDAATTGDATEKSNTSQIPVRLQVSADLAVIEPDAATQKLTLTLSGNVVGAYDLREVSDAGQPIGEAASYPFSGARAIIKLIPASGEGASRTRADFDLEITGSADKQLQIDLPSFDLKP